MMKSNKINIIIKCRKRRFYVLIVIAIPTKKTKKKLMKDTKKLSNYEDLEIKVN